MRTTTDLQRPRRRTSRLIGLLALVALLLATAGSAAVAPGGRRPELTLAGAAPSAGGGRGDQPPLVQIDPGSSASGQRLAAQAADLLQRHGQLPSQRWAALRAPHGDGGEPPALAIDACDGCGGRDLARATLAGGRCEVVLELPAIERQASFWGVGAGGLAAVAVRRAEEPCLRATGIGTGDAAAVDAQELLAGQIGGPRLVDAAYAWVSGSAEARQTIRSAVLLVQRYGQLAPQRRAEARHRHDNQVERIEVSSCTGCLGHDLGKTKIDDPRHQPVRCQIELNLANVRREAAYWLVDPQTMAADVLAHEQEHCLRLPDDRETPAIDEEARFARLTGDAGLSGAVDSYYALLDSTGHWRD
jgi:hypothetical protein